MAAPDKVSARRAANAIAEALSTLLTNQAERARLGLAGRRRIESRFSWKLAAQQMTTLYRQVIEEEQLTSTADRP